MDTIPTPRNRNVCVECGYWRRWHRPNPSHQLRHPVDASSSPRTVCLPEAPCPSGTCEGGEFCLDEAKMLCNPLDKYCIDESLICDGVVNCGAFDHSDEEGCKIIMLDYVTVSVVASI